MAMRHTDSGFIMVDALLSVFIVVCMCGLCFSIYKAIDKYEQGYLSYLSNSQDNIENILRNLPYCEVCVTDEHD